MSNLPLCDKCGQPVQPDNNARQMLLLMGRHGISIPEDMARHMLPVEGCEGSPSMAQYLPDQPRDTRPHRLSIPYSQSAEIQVRAAYRELRGSMITCHPPIPQYPDDFVD